MTPWKKYIRIRDTLAITLLFVVLFLCVKTYLRDRAENLDLQDRIEYMTQQLFVLEQQHQQKGAVE